MTLTDAQITQLLAPLSPGRVRSLSGNAHLEAWDDRRWLLRIFGWGGFDIRTIECVCVSERSAWDENNPLKGRHTVVYRAQVELTIKANGQPVAVFQDGACGDGINQPSLNDAHDFAMKTALSQALKRCCVNLGDQFGLSLYDRGRAGTTVVGNSIAHNLTTQHPVRDDVQGGELDEQTAISEAPQQEPDAPAEAPAAPPTDPGGVSLSSPAVSDEALRASTAARVEALRLRVEALLKQKDAKHAMADLTRVNLAAGKEKLMNEQVQVEGGEITVAVFLDNALKSLARAGSAS